MLARSRIHGFPNAAKHHRKLRKSEGFYSILALRLLNIRPIFMHGSGTIGSTRRSDKMGLPSGSDKRSIAGEYEMKTLIAAAAAFGLLSVPQMAFAAETVAITVSSEGLDLSQRADMRKLRARIADAAAEACDPSDRMIITPMPDYQCRRAAIASVEPAVQQMARAARHTAVARNR
jgi:UrcA family protein